jgi:hydroxypyruvate reductase
MAQGAVAALDAQIAGGVIVVPADHVPAGFDPATHGLSVMYGSHPLPDEASLAAGQSVADFVAGLDAKAQVLFLVSGGASSLVESLIPGTSLADLQALNRWALQSGAAIAQVNALRRRISRLKGGGLARIALGRRTHALMISDAPGDDPRIIGSGLLHAFPHEPAGAPGMAALSPELRDFLDRLHSSPRNHADVPRCRCGSWHRPGWPVARSSNGKRTGCRPA